MFLDCSELKTLPKGMLDDCKKLKSVDSMFSGSGLEEIPSGLFDNCPKLKSAKKIFSQTNIKSLPDGLFKNTRLVNASEMCKQCH